MYRLTLYYLIFLDFVAMILALFHKLPFSFLQIFLSAGILILSSLFFNFIFSKIFNARTKTESVLITALILALIISPGAPILFLILAALLAMASKYLLAVNRHHILNPAAIAVVLGTLILGQSASWWVGTVWLVPFVLIGGIYLTVKIRRFNEAAFFILLVLAFLFFAYLTRGGATSAWHILNLTLTTSALLFFSFAMLTEPLTTPGNKNLRLIFIAFVAILFITPQLHPFGVNLTPELSLCFGNIFAYIYRPTPKPTSKVGYMVQS